LKKALQKTQWKNARWFFLFLGWFGSAGCRPPYSSVLIRTHPYTGCRSPRHNADEYHRALPEAYLCADKISDARDIYAAEKGVPVNPLRNV
jgi:hypothetical protein